VVRLPFARFAKLSEGSRLAVPRGISSGTIFDLSHAGFGKKSHREAAEKALFRSRRKPLTCGFVGPWSVEWD
jgi:hypothetical protein